ncbi:hypothetical protein J27TS8_41560 [Robertmurraya siralis]|uniref:Uncharacterized protein n=1 Tax=Robertmurraya siralis TaxID=77777 RepID=A0A919WLY9_9BACI|nr:hypothetical protein [Robertmurraya siralis]PAE18807.1 hypothetical protein CHH80_20090 [Bacillus sp. 7504-2]GIN64163.1 hypothetical protein J27TS8_41560 [Robertmurraya siralis]
MKVLTQSTRYDLLRAQFNLDSQSAMNDEMRNSLNRIFSYVFNHTKIMYLEFIDEKVCCNYIKFHHANQFEEVSYMETLKDIKNFNNFIQNIKSIKNAPNIKPSIINYSFWMRLDK